MGSPLCPVTSEDRGGGGGSSVADPNSRAGLFIKGRGGGVRNANRNKRSRGRSLLHCQDTGEIQDCRSGIEQWLAVGSGWWRLAVGGWR